MGSPLVGSYRHHLIWIYAWLLRGQLGLRSSSEAIAIGIFWLVLTVLAETFLVGRLLGKHSWDVILANYDILHGSLWPLVVVWVGILPSLLYYFRQR